MFQHFIEKIKTHTKVGVFSHMRPDGDCLGAQTALCLWLEKNGIKAMAFNEDPVPDNLLWMADYFPIKKPTSHDLSKFDAFVVVDGNALHRFGESAKTLEMYKKPIYMIDHHPQPDDIFEESISEIGSSSTCELVYNLYLEYDESQIDEKAAKALYAGLVTDTGSFQFDSVSPLTLKTAARLMELGKFRPDEVVEQIFANKTLAQIKLLSLALNTIALHADNQIASMYVTQDMLTATGTQREDTEGFVNYPLNIEGVMASVLFREDDNKIKISLRSRSDIDVNAWAREFDGGGHKKAAGATHPGPLGKAIKEVIEKGSEQL